MKYQPQKSYYLPRHSRSDLLQLSPEELVDLVIQTDSSVAWELTEKMKLQDETALLKGELSDMENARRREISRGMTEKMKLREEIARLKGEYDDLLNVYREAQASRNRSIERELGEKLKLRLEIDRLRSELEISKQVTDLSCIGLEFCPDCRNYFDSEADRTCPYC